MKQHRKLSFHNELSQMRSAVGLFGSPVGMCNGLRTLNRAAPAMANGAGFVCIVRSTRFSELIASGVLCEIAPARSIEI